MLKSLLPLVWLCVGVHLSGDCLEAPKDDVNCFVPESSTALDLDNLSETSSLQAEASSDDATEETPEAEAVKH